MSGVDLVDGTPILDLKVRCMHPILGVMVLKVVNVVKIRIRVDKKKENS